MTLLTESFLSKYPDMPNHMTEMASFVFYRTYSRWLDNQGRRETWKEAVTRAINYNVSISLKQFEHNKYTPPIDKVQAEAEVLFDNVFNLRQFLSGRTHWVGGSESGVSKKFPLANFNCSFVDMTTWADLCDLFYLLLVGTGVGFRCTKENAAKLSPIREDFTLLHSEYKPLKPEERLEHTKINIMENGYAKIYIGDSKEGWVQALRKFFKLLTQHQYSYIKTIKISYNSIRPAGERLKTFGGTASGHLPMLEMFEGFEKVIKGMMDDTVAPLETVCHKDKCDLLYGDLQECHACSPWRQARPIHILDMGNLIGNNVVVGGVRRTAEIFMMDEDDYEVMWAKNDIEDKPHLHHRFMSNNSIVFEKKPTREKLHKIFNLMKQSGEPGFINMEAAKKRRPNAKGLNPCGEVILDSYGVCNLTTVNVMAFVSPVKLDDNTVDYYILDFQGLMQAQALSTRAGVRMTCIDLELTTWNEVHKRDRLIGCSLTGWKDAMEKLNYDSDQEANLLSALSECVHKESVRYSHVLRIPTPLCATTVKPEGTLSQVAGGVSSGLHVSYAPYYIRRIRINSNDPLVKIALDLNWHIQPEVGSTWDNARTYVIDFPVKSPTKKTRAEQTVKEQFDTYFMFQESYTTHNSSNTITVKDDEWDEAEQIVWDNWDNFVGVTFMPFDGGTYKLAPYEECTEEEYEKLKAKMKPFKAEYLQLAESEEACTIEIEESEENCEGGVCPIR